VERECRIGIVGGNLAGDLDGIGGSALSALATMESMFASSVSGSIRQGQQFLVAGRSLQPGSYTYATLGAVPMRTALTTPVDNQIFFAGEALSILEQSSLPGEYDSGQTATRLVLYALRA
jgi:hypothetical protein